MRAPQRRYPFAPLARQLELRLGEDVLVTAQGQKLVVGPTDERMAVMLDTSRRQIQRWRAEGLTPAAADKAAIAFGWDPYQLWPEMLDEAVEAERERQQEAIRRKRAKVRAYDAKNRAKKRRYNTSYYERNRDRLLEKQRDRDRAKAREQRETAA